MQTYQVSSTAKTDLIYESRAEDRVVVMDAGSGENKGQSPMELVLSALAGCATVDVIEILKKRRKTVDGLTVDADAERRDEPFPRIFTKIKLTFKLSSPDASQEELDKAIALSVEKYCSVRGMITPEAEVVTEGVLIRP